MNDKIYQGDALEVLQSLEAQKVDMCVTSPPYWGLRDYGVDGQLGLELDFEEYIEKLCNIFDEVKRVLKDEGSCWVNIGDSYNGSGKAGKNPEYQKKHTSFGKVMTEKSKFGMPTNDKRIGKKSLIGIPFRFAIEMINRGWILRNTIIWHKPNCMPSSVKDRFTVDFEYLFFFSKNKKYYFEQQFEPIKTESLKRIMQPNFDNQKGGDKDYGKTGVNPSNSMRKSLENWKKNMMPPIGGRKHKANGNPTYSGNEVPIPIKGRNKRCVWEITTKPYKGAHFAVFPEDLIETPIKAGCPENGIVLDPFMGSGTTATVAKKQGKHYIGIELNPDYLPLINERLDKCQTELCA
jgi:DNA modification methylase